MVASRLTKGVQLCPPVPFVSPGPLSWLALASPRWPPAVTAAAPASRRLVSSSSGGASGGGKKIALLLPESKTTRYETFDRPLFEAAVKEDCPNCTVIYSNADQDASKQQQQAEAALTQGANVLVLDPVDGKAAASVAASAKSQSVPVIAYDRFIAGAVDYYVSFDNEKVGKLQAQTLVDTLKAGGKTLGRHRHDQRLADRPQRRPASRRARTASSTPAASRSPPSTTPRTGARTRRRPWMEGQITAVKGEPRRRVRRQRRHRRRRHRGPEGRRRQARSRRSPARTPSSPPSSGSSPATSP